MKSRGVNARERSAFAEDRRFLGACGRMLVTRVGTSHTAKREVEVRCTDAYKVYTRNYADDDGQIARKLAAGKSLQRQPGVKIMYGVSCCRIFGVASVVEESIVLDYSVSRSSENSHNRTLTEEGGDVFSAKTCWYWAELDTAV